MTHIPSRDRRTRAFRTLILLHPVSGFSAGNESILFFSLSTAGFSISEAENEDGQRPRVGRRSFIPFGHRFHRGCMAPMYIRVENPFDWGRKLTSIN